MRNRAVDMAIGPVAAILLASAASSCTEPTRAAKTEMSATATDPIGDTFGSGARWDLTGLTITEETGAILVRLDFSTNVISPMSGDVMAMIGFVDFDVDQDATSGVVATVDEFRPNGGSTDMGADYELVLTNYAADSTVAVIDSLGNPTGRVKPVFAANHVTIRIPTSMLGNDDGQLNAAAIVGVTGRPSDIIPEDGHLTVGATSVAALGPVSLLRAPALGSVRITRRSFPHQATSALRR